VVVATPLDPKRQKRARAKCLERLCWEIEYLGWNCQISQGRWRYGGVDLPRSGSRTVGTGSGPGNGHRIQLVHNQCCASGRSCHGDITSHRTGSIGPDSPCHDRRRFQVSERLTATQITSGPWRRKRRVASAIPEPTGVMDGRAAFREIGAAPVSESMLRIGSLHIILCTWGQC
jgi:hypothetical protein